MDYNAVYWRLGQEFFDKTKNGEIISGPRPCPISSTCLQHSGEGQREGRHHYCGVYGETHTRLLVQGICKPSVQDSPSPPPFFFHQSRDPEMNWQKTESNGERTCVRTQSYMTKKQSAKIKEERTNRKRVEEVNTDRLYRWLQSTCQLFTCPLRNRACITALLQASRL